MAVTAGRADSTDRRNISISFTDRLDHALAEITIGLHKPDLIDKHVSWHGVTDIARSTLTYVDHPNHRPIHRACDDLTPAEAEES